MNKTQIKEDKISYSVDSSSREAIQAIQFELWPDCNNGCEYCYLKGTRRITSIEEKNNNIKNTIRTIMNFEIYNKYNAIGLIGGEFFSGQLVNVEKQWFNLIENINILLNQSKIKEFWLATALLFDDTQILDQTLNRLNIAQLKKDQCIRICTSYDTVGRFRNKEKENLWIKNVEYIKENYPQIEIHTQTILTQDTIEKLIENPNYFDFLNNLSTIDFRYPSISRKDCPTATGIKDYRGMMLKRLSQFPAKFFIEDRNLFLKFLRKFYEKYGIIKIQNLIHQPEMRSRYLKIYVEDIEIEDRWNDTRDVYLPCGHLVDGLCYINDDKHCIYCDIEKFIKNLNNMEL